MIARMWTRVLDGVGWLLILVMGICAALSPPAFGDIVALTSVQDNTLYESATGSISNGAGSAMFAGRNSAPIDSIRRAVLTFSVADAIPAGSTILNAELTLYNSAANTSPSTLGLYRLLSHWGEGSSVASGGQGAGAPAQVGDATWLHTSFPNAFWATPGGDFVAAASASLLVGGPGYYAWSSTAALTSDVQDWLDHPEADHGWIVMGDESVSSSARRFGTREALDPAERPVLVIEFQAVPEPAFAGPLLLLWASLRRRARLGLALPHHRP